MLKVSKNFCAELCEFAINCNEHDTDGCELKKMSIEIDKIARAVSDYKTQLIDVDELISQIDGAWSESNHRPFSF